MYALRRRNVSRMGRKALTIISILKAKTQLRVEAAAGAQCHDGDSSKLIDSWKFPYDDKWRAYYAEVSVDDK